MGLFENISLKGYFFPLKFVGKLAACLIGVLKSNAMSACLAAGSDKSKTSMHDSCNAHAWNLSTAK